MLGLDKHKKTFGSKITGKICLYENLPSLNVARKRSHFVVVNHGGFGKVT